MPSVVGGSKNFPNGSPLNKGVRAMKGWVKVAIVLAIALMGLEIIARIYVENLWFRELNFQSVFWKRLRWQGSITLVAGFISWAFIVFQVKVANRLAHEEAQLKSLAVTQAASAPVPVAIGSRYLPMPAPPVGPKAHSRPLPLPVLLPLIIALQIILVALVMYYVFITIQVWTPDYTLPNITPAVPQPFRLRLLFTNFSNGRAQLGATALAGILALIGVLRGPKLLPGLVFILSGVWGLLLSGNWFRLLLSFNSQSFNAIDPQFHRDISFYIFQIPLWQLLESWWRGLFLFSLLAVTLIILKSGNSLSEGRFPGFSPAQLRHLSALGAAVAATLAVEHWLKRYGYLFANHGVVYGANYTDVHWRLPVETGLAIFTVAIAIWSGWLSLKGWPSGKGTGAPQRRGQLPLIGLWLPMSVYLLILLLQNLGGWAIELLVVQPNQLTRERPYLARNIAATREAFNLQIIQPTTLSGRGQLTPASLESNRLTLDNIRLWDPIPLLKTNRQLQQIRLYYKFVDADLDRYTIRVQKDDTQTISTAKQQVLIAPRELDYTAVPEKAQTWVNKHLVYTHGYGFTLSPVNLVDQGGLPYYFVKDIGTDENEGALRTSSELIRTSIPIGKPRIYFGEITDNYIMTNTAIPELDFPSGEENVYNFYDGRGGIFLNSPLRKLLFAVYLRDWQMLFTENFKPDTRILFRRNINHRIRHIAPFLRFDRDPYLVTAKVKGEEHSTLYWLIDAYTTSNYYPYSDPGEGDANQPGRNFNYIRNSVKILVDAYNGDVRLFTIDKQDPLINAWQKIFPELFLPFSSMPATLKSHIRYPVDMFSTQSERLLTYHMEDIDVFYNREDQWRIPQETYADEQQPIAPYYLIMKLAGIDAKEEEFVLSQVYTPNARNNLIALLFARCDEQNYGKLLLYTLPKERLVYGPEQIEALVNQDPVISERISLWNRRGSRAIQGNLLVIPIEESLLYVEPIYLEAEKNSLPTLARVVVVYGNQIVMAESLNEAIDAIFSPDSLGGEAIVRPVDGVVNGINNELN
ncbi:UPF0182 family protein [Synechocystis sp. PCC 7338]|uniref:UPF0182 family protein n=1 Tax=Synechocystis sp. PCC 7338 TaxID=2732530 RepID=UPI001BAFE5F0|nr:UPF0182 family protein [Synechocystis sp. PCC 7338]QUS60265.1 UPF0182 family protein [Synechocystis sp. PCC 7338]